MKRCSKCGASHPTTIEFFHRSKKGKNGLDSFCKVCANQKKQKWRAGNPSRLKVLRKRHATKRKDKANAENRIRYKTDPFFRARKNIQHRILEVMRNTNEFSHSLGCSGTELKKHLETQFKDGMSWEDYGQWHIDHRIPLSWAYTQGEESFKNACHYTNLQPLWASENLRKGNKLPIPHKFSEF